MDIDNVRGVLDIACTGRESSAKRHAATTSSLSGGERSYSTVAFIMALWECVELPFCFMDEFDVFMVSCDSAMYRVSHFATPPLHHDALYGSALLFYVRVYSEL